MIELRESEGKGLGLFATEDIAEGVIVHIAPAVIITREAFKRVIDTPLGDYLFEYDEGHNAMVLGYGMLFNHSYEPNTDYDVDYNNKAFAFRTLKPVAKDAELTINYNGDPDCKNPLWFDVK